MGREDTITPASAAGVFEITGQPQIGVAVSQEAQDVARLLEAPNSPTSPRYDNVGFPIFSDVIARVEHGETVTMPHDEFEQAVDASRTYVSAGTAIVDATTDKKNSGAFLIGIARRFKGFRGIGFPDSNASATIVTVTDKSIPEENIPEVVMQAGVELESFATQQLHLSVDIPQGLTDRSGQPISAEVMQAKLEATLRRILKPSDRAIVRFQRAISVHNWKRLARLIREGKVSHTLVKVDQDFVVKPIPLHATPNEPIAENRADAQSSS